MKFNLKRIMSNDTAHNEGFGASGGATRPSGSAEQHLLALVRALPIPPPAASCRHVVGKCLQCVLLGRQCAGKFSISAIYPSPFHLSISSLSPGII